MGPFPRVLLYGCTPQAKSLKNVKRIFDIDRQPPLLLHKLLSKTGIGCVLRTCNPCKPIDQPAVLNFLLNASVTISAVSSGLAK
jgi:hypothetical protein